MELMPASYREWTEILARIRFGKVRVAGKNITGASIKAVAGRYASYSDSNGTRIRPGIARVAVDLEVDCRTVKTAVAHLRKIGLLELVRAGGRRGADEYRLTLPTDLLDRDDLTVWSPTEQRAEIDRLSDARRRFPKPSPKGPDGGGMEGPQAPVIETESQGPQAPTKAPSDAPIMGATGAHKDPIMGASGSLYEGPQAPATYQDHYTTTATDHCDEDVRTAVTGPRETGAETTNPKSSLRPEKCPNHGLGGGLRPDGLPECTFCRREQRAGPPEPEPPPDRPPRCRHGLPVADGTRCAGCLAEQLPENVIDLDSRRTA